jgi:ATP-dependent helicase HepA
VYLLECIAPLQLHVDRFLPPTPIVVRAEGDELEDLLESAREEAEAKVPEIVEDARRSMAAQLQFEIARLRQLQKANPTVRQEEIDLLVEQRRDLDEHLSSARLRLDALRCGPM